MFGSPNLTASTLEQMGTQPGMAYFAGTGPLGSYCKDCRFYRSVRGRSGSCSKFAEMMNRRSAVNYQGNPQACKFFEAPPPPEVPLFPRFKR